MFFFKKALLQVAVYFSDWLIVHIYIPNFLITKWTNTHIFKKILNMCVFKYI